LSTPSKDGAVYEPSGPATVMTPSCVRSLKMVKYAFAALLDGRPCVIQTVFWPPAPSSSSALLKDAPGGGTGMNGALHAHRMVNAPSSVASFSRRRLGGLSPGGLSPCGLRGIAFM
jgi:hypothetical protein